MTQRCPRKSHFDNDRHSTTTREHHCFITLWLFCSFYILNIIETIIDKYKIPFRPDNVFTIDNENSIDLDDAISIHPTVAEEFVLAKITKSSVIL